MKVTAEKSKTNHRLEPQLGPRVSTFLFLAAKPAPDGLAALPLSSFLSNFLSNLPHKDA
jgi:hypothetical protein